MCSRPKATSPWVGVAPAAALAAAAALAGLAAAAVTATVADLDAAAASTLADPRRSDSKNCG